MDHNVTTKAPTKKTPPTEPITEVTAAPVTPTPSSPQSKLGVPQAIIIAAVIVAVGLIVGLGGKSSAPASNGPVPRPGNSVEEITKLVGKMGINKYEFTTCMESDRHLADIERDEAPVAQTGEGTPFNVIVTPKHIFALRGAVEYKVMNEILDAALTKDDFVVPEEFAVTLDPALFTITATDHVRGSADAPVKIFEYSDIDCPFCIKFHPEISKLASTRTDVAWIYRHHPLDNLHPNARMKAEATQCAAELGGKDAFWTLLDTLMK